MRRGAASCAQSLVFLLLLGDGGRAGALLWGGVTGVGLDMSAVIHSLPERLSVPPCLCWGHFSPSWPGLAGGLGAVFVIQIDE